MEKIVINGNHKLSGEIKIGGSKNSVVALIPAAILSFGKSTIYNVPEISDVNKLIEILKLLNCDITYDNDKIIIDSKNLINQLIPENLGDKLRASYYFMGCLLGRFKKVEMFFPGGCNIGERPIDLHLKGFKKLGATVSIDENKYLIEAEKLKGSKIYLDIASVGATINIMFAAIYAEGTTIIENAAKEPEIVNIATFLNNMGAKVTGAGTSEITIVGVSSTKSASIETIPDRMEAGTYVIIGALMGDNLKISNLIPKHLDALIAKLKEMNVNFIIKDNEIILNQHKKLKPVNIRTLGYPGFPTDLGQPISVLLSQCDGTSIFEETIWSNRTGHVPYLNDMGAKIKINNRNLVISGPTPLQGKDVVSTDLRGGAAMIIAGLIAKGKTEIFEIQHILRGYDDIVGKLQKVGAKIELKEIK